MLTPPPSKTSTSRGARIQVSPCSRLPGSVVALPHGFRCGRRRAAAGTRRCDRHRRPGRPACLGRGHRAGARRHALGLDDANALATAFGKRLRLEMETAGDAVAAGRALVQRTGPVSCSPAPTPPSSRRSPAPSGPRSCSTSAPTTTASAPSAAPATSSIWRRARRWAPTRSSAGSPASAARPPGRSRPTAARALQPAFRRALSHRNARLVTPEEASIRVLALADGALCPAVARARAAGQGDAVAGLDDAVVAAAGPDDAAGVGAFLVSAPPFDGHKGVALTARKTRSRSSRPARSASPARCPPAATRKRSRSRRTASTSGSRTRTPTPPRWSRLTAARCARPCPWASSPRASPCVATTRSCTSPPRRRTPSR